MLEVMDTEGGVKKLLLREEEVAKLTGFAVATLRWRRCRVIHLMTC